MKTRLTMRNFRRKRRSCPLCKPNKTHGDDARDIRTVRESFGHEGQLREAAYPA
jgi:hypothetical protein